MSNPEPHNNIKAFRPFKYSLIGRRKFKIVQDLELIKPDFLTILYKRRTKRVHSTPSIDKISKILYHACKISEIDIDDSGLILSKRTTPSAGSRHPIDIMISLPKTERNFELYSPLTHSIASLDIGRKEIDIFFDHLNQSLDTSNSCVLWFNIQVQKTESKYLNATSLYWKDLGALLYCIQLLCTYYGLKSCPLGTLAIDQFKNLFQSKNLISGGGIIIGE